MKSPSKEEHQFLAAALGYAARGWRVFPLVPHGKQPLTKRGFKDATSNRHQILQWWQTIPDANIGLATGDPFDVLDLDGTAAVPALRAILGATYHHDGPVVWTGKGWHFFFAASGHGNRAALLGGKLDYRGAGGYVVGPPSFHPSGKQYQWDEGRGPERALPELPADLDHLIAKPTTAPAPAAIVRRNPDGTFDITTTKHGAIAVERPDIIMVADSLGLTVVPHGRLWATNCIFHDDPGPSMVLYTGQNTFYCYGCEAKGDSHDLAAKKDMTGRVGII